MTCNLNLFTFRALCTFGFRTLLTIVVYCVYLHSVLHFSLTATKNCDHLLPRDEHSHLTSKRTISIHFYEIMLLNDCMVGRIWTLVILVDGETF